LLEFIEPVEANAACFSHRTYGLLLRSSTEFESLAKDLLLEAGNQKPPESMNIQDYRALEAHHHLEGVAVSFLLWRPDPRHVLPYQGWSTAQPPLRWYQNYNTVKHNRNAQFPLASISTLIEAMAALFCLVAKASKFDWGPVSQATRDDLGERFMRGAFQMRAPKLGVFPA